MDFKSVSIRPATPKAKGLYGRYRYKVLKGGRASTKSWCVAEALIHYASTFRTRIVCAREIQRSIEESSYQLLKDTISRLGMDEIFTITKNKIICKQTGSSFTFRGLSSSTENSLKSTEGVDIVWVEEAQTITKASLEILIPTVRKGGSEIWFTFNPNLPTDPVWQLFCTGHPPEGTYIAHINYLEVKHVLSDEIIAEAEYMLATDPDRYRHIWLGELDDTSDDAIITQQIIDEAKDQNPMVVRTAPVIAGLDVARYGGDRSCFYVRQGLHSKAVKVYQHMKGPVLKQEIVSQCIKYAVTELIIDVNGVGDFLQDDFAILLPGVKITEFRGGFKASSNTFKNARVECWWKVREALEEGLQIPDDHSLVGQLIAQKYFYNTRGQKQMVDKEKMRSEGVPSPDMGDALSMTFYSSARKTEDKDAIINAML